MEFNNYKDSDDFEDYGNNYLILFKVKKEISLGLYTTYTSQIIINAETEKEALDIFNNYFSDFFHFKPEKKDIVTINLSNIPYIEGIYEDGNEIE